MVGIGDLYGDFKTLCKQWFYEKSEVDTALNGKQATLVSGTNIKTVNNQSLLGTGNISIQGGGTGVDIATSWGDPTSDSKVPSEKLVKDSLDGKANSTHYHGNLQNNGQVGGTAQSNKNVVTDGNGLITTEDKPIIPSASSTTPSADTTNGSVGNGTTWAKSDHTHPKSSLYAESTHTHEEYIQNQEFYFDGDDFVIISDESTITKTLTIAWDDNNDARGLRPRYLQATISGITAYLSEESEWSVSVPVDSEGTYMWSVPTVVGYIMIGMSEVDNVTTVTLRMRTTPE